MQKQMSTNKVLALIGSILSSFVLGVSGVVLLLLGIGMIAESYAYYYESAILFFAIFFLFLALISFAILAFNWVAFAKLDKAEDGPWKVYFLVVGILSIVTGVNFISGILFILAFVLNHGAPRVSNENSWERETDSWTEVGGSSLATSQPLSDAELNLKESENSVEHSAFVPVSVLGSTSGIGKEVDGWTDIKSMDSASASSELAWSEISFSVSNSFASSSTVSSSSESLTEEAKSESSSLSESLFSSSLVFGNPTEASSEADETDK